MLEDTFANRLKMALEYNNMKPVELANKTHINKSLISNYRLENCGSPVLKEKNDFCCLPVAY